MTATLGLHLLPGRCAHGYDVATQHPALCACPGIAAGVLGMAAALEANQDESARVELVIRQLAATGKPFSANDARALHGVKGGVVGATFNALRTQGVIAAVGGEASTDRGTHGKSVALWIGAAA